MNKFTYRNAIINDIPFLVDTIIEAEKSGTDILTYTTIFGLTEKETRDYLGKMLQEEINGCELSISSFILAEIENEIVAAVASWVEGDEGISSTALKGNLLNYFLPKKCIEHAVALSNITRDLHIEYFTGAIQIGLVYVAKKARGLNLVCLLIEEQIKKHRLNNPSISEVFVQVFSNNIPAIRAYEKTGFKIVLEKESTNSEISLYMPYKSKTLMKKEI